MHLCYLIDDVLTIKQKYSSVLYDDKADMFHNKIIFDHFFFYKSFK